MTWDAGQLKDQFERIERMAQTAQDDCRREIRSGKRHYEDFHDEEAAKECIANRCKTIDGLASRDRMVARLRELRGIAADRRLHFKPFYDANAFHNAALSYIDALIARFEDATAPLDIRSV